jgi:hypothetical protein
MVSHEHDCRYLAGSVPSLDAHMLQGYSSRNSENELYQDRPNLSSTTTIGEGNNYTQQYAEIALSKMNLKSVGRQDILDIFH